MKSESTKTHLYSFGKLLGPGMAYRVHVAGTASENLIAMPVGEGGVFVLVDPVEIGGETSAKGLVGEVPVIEPGGPFDPDTMAERVADYVLAAFGSRSRLFADVVNMERSVSALGPAIAALDVETSPPLASAIQATENLWAAIDRKWGLLRSTEVAELLGSKTRNRSFASNLRKNGRLIGIERANAYVYPGFQFNRKSGTVHDVIPRLISAARDEGIDDEDLVFWLCSPSRYFEDDLPVDHLLDDPGIVDKLVASESISW